MQGLLQELAWRGLLHDHTPALGDRLTIGPITGYIGFDPTASSLQIGNLVPVMLLAHLQRAGGTPVFLVGGGTGMIGDPSGKRAERPLLSLDEIDRNVARLKAQLSQFLDFSGNTPARVVNNADWLRSVALIDFLREVGKHFTLSIMLQKESVKSRLDAGISFTEFSYMLLQAYDFLHLYRTEHCELQMGGSDQWGNITSGVELIRRATGETAHALCAPLITTATGTKFGKSEGESVWLDPTRTSPYKFFQFWINADDRDVERYLGMFTFRTRPDIESLMASHRVDPGRRKAHHELAMDVTARVHGPSVTNRVAVASDLLFTRGPVQHADEATWEVLAKELPSWRTTRGEFPLPVVDLVARAGLTSSKSEARRQLQQGGISINGDRAAGDDVLDVDRLQAGRYLWLRRGKKTDVIVTADP